MTLMGLLNYSTTTFSITAQPQYFRYTIVTTNYHNIKSYHSFVSSWEKKSKLHNWEVALLELPKRTNLSFYVTQILLQTAMFIYITIANEAKDMATWLKTHLLPILVNFFLVFYP